MKLLKFMRADPERSTYGFTLIELLVVIFIVTILSAIVVLSVMGIFKPAGDAAYTASKSEIVNAMTAYVSSSKYLSAGPTLAGKYSVGGTNYSVVDFSLLLSEGLIKHTPNGLYLGSAAGYDNCNGNNSLGCKAKNHYVWLVDYTGNVYSVCINTTANKGGCAAANASGYQGVWP